MRNVHRVSTKQHGDVKSGVRDPKTQPSCKLGVLVHCLAQTRKSLTIPQTRKCDCFAHFFCGCNLKLQEFIINEPGFSPSKQGSN